MKSLRLALCLAPLMLAPMSHAFAQQPQQQSKQAPKEEKTFPKDSNWTLRSLNGKPVPAGMEATMRIDNQFRGAGFAGCNTWSATMWPVRGQRFAVGGVAVTKKACPQPAMRRMHRVLPHLPKQQPGYPDVQYNGQGRKTDGNCSIALQGKCR